MARRKITPDAPEAAREPVAAPVVEMENGESPTRRRRRRRTQNTAPDYAAETVSLVEAALRSRGARGASQELLQSVISWARSVRAEGEELKLLQGRPRRQKTQAPADRLVRYEMNRALLDGILAGTIVLDVQENGDLLFLHGNHLRSGDVDAEMILQPITTAEENE